MDCKQYNKDLKALSHQTLEKGLDMKKIFLFVIILLFSSQIYSKENTDSSSGTESKSESTLPQFFKSFTECNYIFDWGVSYAQLNRHCYRKRNLKRKRNL